MNDFYVSFNLLINIQGLKKIFLFFKNEIVIFFFLLNIELWLYCIFCLIEEVNCFVYILSLYLFKLSWNRLYIVYIGN